MGDKRVGGSASLFFLLKITGGSGYCNHSMGCESRACRVKNLRVERKYSSKSFNIIFVKIKRRASTKSGSNNNHFELFLISDILYL